MKWWLIVCPVCADIVVPHAGTWIEIKASALDVTLLTVVPHAGTWIEITGVADNTATVVVVPHAGTWIEILMYDLVNKLFMSFPTRERGLKFL